MGNMSAPQYLVQSQPPDRSVGLDLGGTNLRAIVTQPNGDGFDLLHREAHPTPRDATGKVDLGSVIRYSTRLVNDWQAARLGVAVAGISSQDGMIRNAVNLGLKDEPIELLLRDALRIPVTVINDGQAAALAEMRVGTGRKYSSTFVIVMGTGVAGAHFADGSLRSGASGQSAEIGHLVVTPGGDRCNCGQYGCLESYSSGWGIARRYERATGVTASSKEVVELARGRDGTALKVAREATHALATAIIAVSILLDPHAIVFSGGLVGAADLLIDPLRAELHDRTTFHRIPEMKISDLDGLAGAIGASLATTLR